MKVDAVVDTGAVRSCIPLHMKQQLGLEPEARTTARYADGRLDDVELTEPVVLEILNRPTVEGCLVLGDEVLIGQTALETTDLLVDCANRRIYPNPDHPDAVVVRIR
jgi:clan AA aspartic protease